MTGAYIFCLAMWIGGTILIVASWVHLVPPTIGWVGFGVAFVGTIVSSGIQQPSGEWQAKPPRGTSEDQSSSAESGFEQYLKEQQENGASEDQPRSAESGAPPDRGSM
jgi:hypothetical protein